MRGPSNEIRPALLLIAVALAAMVVFAALTLRTPEPEGYHGPTPVVTVEAPDVVLFIGDSYTQGAGVDAPWPRLVAEDLGWLEANKGLGGTGYVATAGPSGCGRSLCSAYPEVILGTGITPSLIIVSGGRNDPLAGFDAGVEATFAALGHRFPDVPVVVTSPLGDDDVAADLDDKAAVVQRAAEAYGARYLDLGQPFAGRPELILSDGVHPNDAGHRVLADAVVAALG